MTQQKRNSTTLNQSSWQNRIVPNHASIKQALAILDEIGVLSNVLFVVNEKNELLGSVTDGDIRRGFLNDASVKDPITSVMNSRCVRAKSTEIDNQFIQWCRQKGINYLPIINAENSIIEVVSVNDYREIISVDAVIMAGGKGERLMPLAGTYQSQCSKLQENQL